MRGLRPHRHAPNLFRPWVVEQHQVWVDLWGNEHEIEMMSADYAANVIRFLEAQAERVCVLVIDECFRRRHKRRASDEELLVELVAVGDTSVWLEETPLMRALRRRAAGVAS